MNLFREQINLFAVKRNRTEEVNTYKVQNVGKKVENSLKKSQLNPGEFTETSSERMEMKLKLIRSRRKEANKLGM
jgi:hypothetical protein